ncbi:MAG: VWA domain-containing protein [Acidimicrobiales bacterium]|nr:VWA domain-containing protein [Acidimicrobiales bacterium]RZV45932.1 MAG: VWA domain-containing protein [Acidimicrobiales bacterium]
MITPTEAKRLLLAFLIALIALLLLAPPVSAQESGDEAPTVEEVENAALLTVTSVERDPETGEVTIEAVSPIELAGGRLPESSISVLANDAFQQFSYAPENTDALQIMLVIDVSGSMLGEPLDAMKEAALSFIDRLPPSVRIGVVTFANQPEVIAPIGTPFDVVSDSISELEVGGETALFDALVTASDALVETEGAPRSVIVALTDGADGASIALPEDAARALDVGRIELHGVALETPDTATEFLADLSLKTGGSFNRAANESLLALYDDLAARLANRFTISFIPNRESSDSAFVVISHQGVLASARVGYEPIEASAATESVGRGESALEVADSATSFALAQPFRMENVGWIGSNTARNIAVGLLAGTLLMFGLLLSFPTPRMTTLASRGREYATNAQVSDFTTRLEGFADRRLDSHGRRSKLTRSLERAGIDLRPGEYVVVAGSAAIAVAFISSLFVPWILSLVFAGAVILGSRALLARQARVRVDDFIEQLPSTLQLIAGALRAGYALPQCAETVASEAESPTADEFHRLVTEHRLGRDFGEALQAMADRIDREEFTWVVQALEIHRTVGGDLAEVLDNINGTLRDRNFVKRQVSALTAEGRYSAYVILSLPFIVAGVLMVTNPEYIGRLFDGLRGALAIMFVFLLMAIGSLWMKMLLKAKY